MSNVFTLDSMREEIEREFAPLKINLADGSEVDLRNILRLPKTERTKAAAQLKVVQEVQKEDTEELTRVDALAEAMLPLLEILAGSKGKKLVEELSDDTMLTLKVFTAWMSRSQPGEAKPSQD
ncbi:hypothetical protein GS454_01345 [Rhodococcus hoagii]|nr:hypothetical protein [Prescottella equi]